MTAWRAGAAGAGGIAVIGAGLALTSEWLARRAEQAVPPDGRFVEVAGARLHYTDIGSGPPIVLIHGLGGQLRNFGYGVAAALSERHRVIAFDRPGSGYSTSTDLDAPGIRSQAAMVAAAIRVLGLDRPLIVGHSLGGAIALALALDHPGLARGLALIAPLALPGMSVPRVLHGIAGHGRPRHWLMSRMMAVPLGRLAATRITAGIFAPEAVPADFGTRGGGLLTLRPGALTAAAEDLAAAEREMSGLAERYTDLRLPIAILFAREDQVLDAHRHGRIASRLIPGARLELVHGGHMLPVTQPDRTTRFILDAAV